MQQDNLYPPTGTCHSVEKAKYIKNEFFSLATLARREGGARGYVVALVKIANYEKNTFELGGVEPTVPHSTAFFVLHCAVENYKLLRGM